MLGETDIIRIIAVISFFAYASTSDWKTRRVKDQMWIILGTLSLAIFWLDLLERNSSAISQIMLLPIAFFFYDIFWDRERGPRKIARLISLVLYFLSILVMLFVGYNIINNEIEWNDEISGPFIAFIMIVLFEIFYMFDIIKGGADAKALICLAILFPWYPEISNNIPLIVPELTDVMTLFSFALSVLFVAALISVVSPLIYLFKNIRAGKRITSKSFIGFLLRIEEVERHFVWLLEWVEDGSLKFSARKPRSSDNLKTDLEVLKNYGKSEVWVTYKIPFIIPITMAIIIVLLVGNPLFLLY